jgi:hypothetical protein
VQTEIAGLKYQDVANREVSVEVILLRRQADQPARRTPLDLVVVSEDSDRAARLLREADDCIDGRRLAGAVGAEKTEEFPGRNAQ